MRKPSISLVVLASTLVVGAWGQTGVEAKYGTRPLRTCASRKEPTRGAPSAQQATQYFACEAEHESGADLLYLVSDVKVEVAPGRPFNILTDSFDAIDVRQPVYDIRGSFTAYQCSKIGMMYKKGQNCNSGQQPQAKGICYKDTFGEWHCKMLDRNAEFTKTNGPPPPPDK
jgi:hypothetical protein